MQTLPMACHGRIVRLSQPEGGESTVGPDGLTATLVNGGAGAPSEIVFEWDIGAPKCPPESVGQFPPFVIAGDSETVQLVDGIIAELQE
jgi:hypothetical protein